MPTRTAEIRSAIMWAIGALVLAGIGFWVAYQALRVLLLVYVSVLLAIGFGPVVRAIERKPAPHVGPRRLPRWVAILVVYLIIVATLTVAGFLIIPPLIDQTRELSGRLPIALAKVQDYLIDHGVITSRVTLEEAVRNAPGTPGAAVGKVATAVTEVFAAVLAFITVLILTFYLLVDSQSLFSGFARLFPRSQRSRVVDVSNRISEKVSARLTGQLILAGTIGASAAIGLYFLGVPYFYVLALVAAIGEVVPIIGPILSAIPAILAGLTVSPHTALFVAIFWIVQQQVENHLLVPKLMGRQVGVSPVVVIVALLIGGAVLGIVGAILAVPTAAILQVMIEQILDERDNNLPRADAV
jgi:predicted PurR-regulated permease PerM